MSQQPQQQPQRAQAGQGLGRASTYNGLLLQQQQQAGGGLSLPARLRRLLTGQFIREMQGRARAAAAETRSSSGGSGGGTSSEQQAAGVHPQIEAVRIEVLQGGYPAAVTAAAARAGGGAVLGAQVRRQASADGQRTADATDSSSGFYPASTHFLVLAMWGVFVAQWWQALPEMWALLAAGQWWQPGAALLLMVPDTPAANGLCLVRAQWRECGEGRGAGATPST